MEHKWTVNKLIAAASLGVLTLVLELAGGGIASVTGIPITPGILNVFVAEIMVVICLFVVDRPGSATIMRTIIGLLSLPLPLLGTPGFLPKVPIAIGAGLLADALYYLLKRNRAAAIVIGGVDEIYYLFALIWIGRLFGMPGVEEAAKLFMTPLMIVLTFVGGAVGGYIGWLIYSRIQNTSVVIRIQGRRK